MFLIISIIAIVIPSFVLIDFFIIDKWFDMENPSKFAIENPKANTIIKNVIRIIIVTLLFSLLYNAFN